MKGFNLPFKSISFGLLVFFALPYILFFRFVSFDVHLSLEEIIWALKNSVIQSTLTALFCTVVGFYFSLGLLQLNLKFQSIISRLALVPQAVPSLFSILIGFAVLNPFIFGHIGVIFIFILINLGFVTYQFYHSIKSNIGQSAVVCEIYGISSGQFFRKVLIPTLWPDIKLNFVFVFLFCLSSLSIPLVAGGGKGTNLEVLIFEKIMIDQNWSSAWVLMVLQTSLVFLISFIFLKSRKQTIKEFVPHKYLKSKIAACGLFIYLLVYLGGYLLYLCQSFEAFEFLKDYYSDIALATLESLKILLVTVAVCYLLLVTWLIDYIKLLKHSLAIHLISASTVLVGFSFYMIFPQTKLYDLVKSPLAFSILFFPMIFKLFFEKNVDQLRNQILVAKVHGVSTKNILFNILFPQMKTTLALALSLLTVWTLSDFAILRSLGAQTSTLGLMTQSFLSSYRLDAAFILSFYILVLWLFISMIFYYLLKGMHVAYKKY